SYNNTAAYARVEIVVTDASGITGITDDRGGPGGVHGGGSGGGGGNAAAYNDATTAEVFGDSYTTGDGASDSSHAWPQLFAAARGWTLTNSAVSGSAVADQALYVFGKTVAGGSQSLFQLGTNDARTYSSVGQMTSFKKMHAASIAWLAMPRANLTLGIDASQ